MEVSPEAESSRLEPTHIAGRSAGSLADGLVLLFAVRLSGFRCFVVVVVVVFVVVVIVVVLCCCCLEVL